ncbi:MAG: hypothetical protein J0I12_11180 [Candidatus Eremiobacteraeota bacterium]|nr:hypothetical protein [Candidatus Eremiobacteraeota bacterium]
MNFGQQIATSKDAGGELSADVLELLGQVETPGINFACRCRDHGPVSVWVYAGKSPTLLRQLDHVIAQAIKDWVATSHPGEQTAVKSPDGTYEIDRQDGLGPVPFGLATQPYCAACDSPCEFGECDPPHLCRKHAACKTCNAN